MYYAISIVVCIRRWLAGIGIFVRDGEGGCPSPPPLCDGPSPHRLSLAEDRLRNGQLIARLLLVSITGFTLLNTQSICLIISLHYIEEVVERNASDHFQLRDRMQLAKSQRSLSGARMLVSSCFWLMRVRRSPPLPKKYLVEVK